MCFGFRNTLSLWLSLLVLSPWKIFHLDENKPHLFSLCVAPVSVCRPITTPYLCEEELAICSPEHSRLLYSSPASETSWKQHYNQRIKSAFSCLSSNLAIKCLILSVMTVSVINLSWMLYFSDAAIFTQCPAAACSFLVFWILFSILLLNPFLCFLSL